MSFGLQKTSLLDFPGRVAAVVFTTGCNLRCPFCHNPELVFSDALEDPYSLDELQRFFHKRKGVLGGVCISGGEPLLCPKLEDLISLIDEADLEWKLDSNGCSPRVMERLFGNKKLSLPNYVAIDLKSDEDRYRGLLGAAAHFSYNTLAESIGLLSEYRIRWEVRTSCAPGIVDERALTSMISFLQELRADDLTKGPQQWALQRFTPGHCLDPAYNKLPAGEDRELEHYRRMIEEAGFPVLIRG